MPMPTEDEGEDEESGLSRGLDWDTRMFKQFYTRLPRATRVRSSIAISTLPAATVVLDPGPHE
jgi:hypothetical protein